jgi:hypothetical protein
VLHAFSLLVVRNIGFAYNAQKGKNCLFKISCLVFRCYVGGFFFVGCKVVERTRENLFSLLSFVYATRHEHLTRNERGLCRITAAVEDTASFFMFPL